MKVDLKKITTEARNKNTMDIDNVSSLEIVKLLNNEDKTVPLAVETQLETIAEAIETAYKTISNEGRLIYIGAGTSGRLGVLDASEIPPTYNVEVSTVVGIMAGGGDAISSANEKGEDSQEAAIKDLKEIDFNDKDFLVGISASGRTPYVTAAIEYAKEIGSKTAAISTTKDSIAGQLADIKIEVVTGAEPITGSTRMKSGTAQKLVLNAISTGTMIRLGKVYENLMIDVKPANDKLIERSISIVQEVTGKIREEIIPVMEQTKYSPKIATVMIMKDISKTEALKLLEDNNDSVSKIMKRIK